MERGWGFRCPLQYHRRRFNTAVGGHALYGNISQSANTAAGAFALAANNPGNQNVAVGQGWFETTPVTAMRPSVVKHSLPIPAARKTWRWDRQHFGATSWALAIPPWVFKAPLLPADLSTQPPAVSPPSLIKRFVTTIWTITPPSVTKPSLTISTASATRLFGRWFGKNVYVLCRKRLSLLAS